MPEAGLHTHPVADGLDSNDEESTLGIQIRGIFNELQLRDLKKKTLRGQKGQKERGFFVGERTFGYGTERRAAAARTGKRRRFDKPESEWITHEDEDLRIVPSELWETVRERRKKVKRSWPGGKGKRGFSAEQGSRQAHFPTHLLSGTMKCGACGAAIAQVSGKAGGYYGCLGAAKGACDNKMLVKRKLAETVIVDAVRERISDPEQIRFVLERVEEEVKRLRSDMPETIRLKEAELS
jgi:hypothetical protein